MKKINDNQIPEIIEEDIWTSFQVRSVCIENNWYTRGDNKAYSEMLDFVDNNEPTKANIYTVARDIMEHSNTDDLYIEAIMFRIANDAVMTHYTVK